VEAERTGAARAGSAQHRCDGVRCDAAAAWALAFWLVGAAPLAQHHSTRRVLALLLLLRLALRVRRRFLAPAAEQPA